jgi:glycosyltransferase involved in cell wall biosynthesis
VALWDNHSVQILFVLPGLHRVHRGAEVVFESIAQEIALEGKHDVTLIGSGDEIPRRAYRFKRVPAVPRERFEGWPSVPLLRHHYMYEELTFAAALFTTQWRHGVDITVTCSYPFTNWVLRSHLPGRLRPAHVFVTQNGDWPARERRREYRFFSCDGLICTNPVYYERNRERWFSTLIPNGTDPARFHPGPGDRAALGLPEDRPVILMVSALVESKRVLEGMRAVARLPDAFLALAGDGPLRHEVDRVAADLLPRRFLRSTFPYERMPDLYRSADVFLHTTVRESFGNVYVEALASGLPIVAHDDEVTRWIFERHAHLVDSTSESALAHALHDALSECGSNSAERAAFATSRYAWSRVASRYRDFLAEVVDRAKSGKASAVR